MSHFPEPGLEKGWAWRPLAEFGKRGLGQRTKTKQSDRCLSWVSTSQRTDKDRYPQCRWTRSLCRRCLLGLFKQDQDVETHLNWQPEHTDYQSWIYLWRQHKMFWNRTVSKKKKKFRKPGIVRKGNWEFPTTEETLQSKCRQTNGPPAGALVQVNATRYSREQVLVYHLAAWGICKALVGCLDPCRSPA